MMQRNLKLTQSNFADNVNLFLTVCEADAIMMLMFFLFVYAVIVLFVFVNSVMEMPVRFGRLIDNLWLISAVAMLWPLIALVLPFTTRPRRMLDGSA